MKKLSIILALAVAFTLISCGGEEESSDPNVTGVYAVGDLYSKNGVKGVVYKVANGGKSGMMIALDEQLNGYSNAANLTVTTNAVDENNGMNNMTIIKTNFNINDYPAFSWCDKKGNNWYLPAKNEMSEIYNMYEKLNTYLTKHGGTPLSNTLLEGKGVYRTSTEGANGTYCYIINFSNGNATPVDKVTNYNVRAVRKF